MRALVTGGTGFIGGHLVRLLQRNGHEVTVYARRSPKAERLARQGVKIHYGDLTDTASLQAAVREADTIFHAGEIAWFGQSRAVLNELACRAILDACKKRSDVKRVILVGSVTTVGIPADQPATEDTPTETLFSSWYDNYKRNCEEMMRRALKDDGIPTAVLRFGWVYGDEGRWVKNLVRMIRRCRNRILPVFGSKKGVMNFIHIDDAAQSLIQAATVPAAAGETFNIVDDEPISFPSFASLLAERLGYHPRVVNVLPLFSPFVPLADVACFLAGSKVRFHPYLQWWNEGVRFSNEKMKNLLHLHLHYPTVGEGLKHFSA